MDDFSRALAAAALLDGQQFSLPGCGTLKGHYISARIDHGAKQVDPPRLEITWSAEENDQESSFATLLARTGATTREAEEIQHRWIQALQSGAPIEVGDYGVLQLDRQSGLIGFTPSEDALANAYWSGDAVPLEPLSKRSISANAKQKVLAEEGNKALVATAESTEDHPKRDRSLLATILPYVAAAAVVVAGVMVWHSSRGGSSSEEPDPAKVVTVNQERLNKSPREEAQLLDSGTTAQVDEHASAIPGADDDAAAALGGIDSHAGASLDDAAADGIASDLPATDFDPAALAGELSAGDFVPVEIEAVIIVGSFGNAQNAARMTERIAAAGLIPFVDQPESLTRVGVSFAASSEADINEMMERLKAEFNPSAWLLEE